MLHGQTFKVNLLYHVPLSQYYFASTVIYRYQLMNYVIKHSKNSFFTFSRVSQSFPDSKSCPTITDKKCGTNCSPEPFILHSIYIDR